MIQVESYVSMHGPSIHDDATQVAHGGIPIKFYMQGLKPLEVQKNLKKTVKRSTNSPKNSAKGAPNRSENPSEFWPKPGPNPCQNSAQPS